MLGAGWDPELDSVLVPAEMDMAGESANGVDACGSLVRWCSLCSSLASSFVGKHGKPLLSNSSKQSAGGISSLVMGVFI